MCECECVCECVSVCVSLSLLLSSWYGDEEEVECPIEWLVNSVIISASVVNSSEVVTGNLTTPVVITLRHADTSLSNPVCSFINEMESLDR